MNLNAWIASIYGHHTSVTETPAGQSRDGVGSGGTLTKSHVAVLPCWQRTPAAWAQRVLSTLCLLCTCLFPSVMPSLIKTALPISSICWRPHPQGPGTLYLLAHSGGGFVCPFVLVLLVLLPFTCRSALHGCQPDPRQCHASDFTGYRKDKLQESNFLYEI